MSEYIFQALDSSVPATRVHSEQFDVLPADIDELNHVNNSVYFRYADRAAVAHADRLGVGFAVMKAAGCIPVVHGHIVKYHKPALLGQTLVDTTWIASCSGARSVRYHEIRRLEDDFLLVQIKTDWVWIDPISSRPKRVPTVVLTAFGF